MKEIFKELKKQCEDNKSGFITEIVYLITTSICIYFVWWVLGTIIKN